MRYIYTIFKVIKDLFEQIWRWWSWDNFLALFLSVVAISLFALIFVLVYGYFFLEKTEGQCYLDSDSFRIVEIKKSIEWAKDPVISVCFVNNVDCVDKILNSNYCK